MKKIFLLFIVIFNSNQLFAQSVFPGEIEILEDKKQVVNLFNDKGPGDYVMNMDGGLGAFRDSANNIVLWSPTERGQYILRTTNFDSIWVDWNWGKVFSSSDDITLKNHNYKEWLMTPYTLDGKKYYGLVHNEYHGWEDPISEHYNKGISDLSWQNYWYNTITTAFSIDGGKTFTQPTPPNEHIAVVSPFKYDPKINHRQGMFNPSNIIFNNSDGYYYATVEAWETEFQIKGLCLIRTKNLSDPKSWRGWTGSGFTAADTTNPYSYSILDQTKKAMAMEPIIRYGIGNVRLAYSDYFKQFIIIGIMGGGIGYRLSPDLIHWTSAKLIYKMNTTNAPVRDSLLSEGAYPVVIDPQDTTRNFERIGRDVYLFWLPTEYRKEGAARSYLINRMKIRFNFGTSPSTTYIVNTESDDDDAELGDGLPITKEGKVSLRAAIVESNFRPTGTDWTNKIYDIKFASTVKKIKLKNEMMEPASFPISIDGLQNGGVANSNNFDLGMNLVPGVEIDCNKFDGLFINGGSSTIRGLNIYNYSGDGGVSFYLKGNNKLEASIIGADKTGTIYKGSLSAVSIDISPNNTIGGLINDKRNLLAGGVYITGATSKNNLVQGNYIGTDISGTKSIGVPGPGILISTKATTNTIGGTTQTSRNLISGNGGNGVEIFNGGSTLNKILFNFIGVDRTGKVALGNKANGVEIDDAATYNTIGQLGAGNVISGNGNGSEAGIYLSYSNDNNIIQSNFIGTDTTQTYSIPNKNHGILIADRSNSNKIGSTVANTGNVIANNFGYGIYAENYTESYDNSFIGNLIYNNNKLDIDLGGGGLNKNDTLDKDTGPNYLINSPLLESISTISNGINLKGSYLGEASKNYFIEFFASQTKHASGHGSAKKQIGSTTVLTNASGIATFDVNITTSIDTTYFITSLSTRYSGTTYYSTSEFSRQLKVGNAFVNIINNSPPKITSKPVDPFVVTIGTPFSLQFKATDKDTIQGDELSWSVASEQYNEWFSIDNTGKLYGNPDNDYGEVDWWDATVKVSDLNNSTDIVNVELIVNPAWPKITSTPLDTITPAPGGQSYQIVIKDSLGNLQTGFTYAVFMNPGFVTINSTTGLVKISPTHQNHSGYKYYILFKATKGTTIIYQGYVIDVKNVNVAPLWENSRVLKISGFYISPGFDTTIHKDSLITFRVVPASDYNKNDTLVYTYNIYNSQTNSLVTSFVADKYNYADSVKYGARETRCVAIKNMSQILQTNIFYECRVSVSDGKTTTNIPTPYLKFKLSSSSNNPTITITASQLLFGKIAIGSTSTAQNFKVSGNYLTSNISITPSTGFEIRTGSNNFSVSAITLTPTSGTVNETTVDVRFAPTAAQHYSGSIKITSTNATDKNITIEGDGTTTAVPFIVSSDSLISFENTTVGKYSDTLSFTITGGNISDTLKLASSEFFEIKTSGSTTFSKLIKIAPSSGSISETKINVRFKPKEANVYTDTILITSTNLLTKIAVNGTGVAQVNNAPIIKSIAEQAVQVNFKYNYQVEAVDVDTATGDTLIYSLSVKPSWLTISSKGLVSGTPSNKNIGDTIFTVKVTDSYGLFATQKNNLKVTSNVDTVVKIYSISPLAGPAGSIVTFKGSNFSSNLSNNSIWFGGVKAAIQSSSNTEMKAIVPSGATYSYPVLLVDSLQATSPKPFTVTFNGSDTPYPSALTGTSAISLATGSNPTRSALADFDDDGKQDLVVVNYGSSNISVYFNNINKRDSIKTTAFQKFDLVAGSNPNGVAIGDVDGDGKLDIVVSNFWSYNISIFKNIHTSGSLTASSFAAKQDVVVSQNAKPGDVALADIDLDGKLDIISTDNNSVNEFGVIVFKNKSTQQNISFGEQKNFPTGKFPKRISVRDANEDGKPDLFIVCEFSTPISNINYLQNKSVADTILFVPKVEIPTGKNPRDIAFADFNNDGLEDFVVPNYEEDSLTVYQNSSTTNQVQYKQAAKYKMPYLFSTNNLLVSPISVATSDINGDGWIDFSVASWGYQSVPHYLNTKTSGAITNNSFKFESANGNITFANNPSSVVLGDLNNDSRPELIVTAYADNKLAIFRNKFGNYFSLSPKTIPDFGNVKVGTKKFALFTMDNGGDDTLFFKPHKSLDSNFKIKNYTALKIAPDEFYTDSVWFAPKLAGTYKGKVVLETQYFSDTLFVEGTGISAPTIAPTLILPTTNAIDRPLNEYLKWRTVPFASVYNLQVSNFKDFSTSITDTTQADTVYFIKNLAGSKKYFWRVRGKNTDGFGPFAIDSFTTEKAKYLVKASAGLNGTIVPSGDTLIIHGDSIKYTITANTGYNIDSVIIDGVQQWGGGISPTTWHTFKHVVAPHSIRSTFKIPAPQVPILVSPATNAINVAVNETLKWKKLETATSYKLQMSLVSDFTSQTKDTTTSDTTKFVSGMQNYKKYYWRVRGANSSGEGPWKADSFTTVIAKYLVKASATQNGKITPVGDTLISHGDSIQYVVQANLGYQIDSLVMDNGVWKVRNHQKTIHTFRNVISNHVIHAAFGVAKLIIFSNAGPNGTITPLGEKIINYGDSIKYVMKPNTGYKVDSVLIKDMYSPTSTYVGKDTVYTFKNVTKDWGIFVKFVVSTGVKEIAGLPQDYSLSQNYPNPFNPTTTIRFGLPSESRVKLEIYNSLGQLISVLVDDKLSAHFYEVKWETGKIPTGLYFYKLSAIDITDAKNNFIKTKKMILMK